MKAFHKTQMLFHRSSFNHHCSEWIIRTDDEFAVQYNFLCISSQHCSIEFTYFQACIRLQLKSPLFVKIKNIQLRHLLALFNVGMNMKEDISDRYGIDLIFAEAFRQWVLVLKERKGKRTQNKGQKREVEPPRKAKQIKCKQRVTSTLSPGIGYGWDDKYMMKLMTLCQLFRSHF